MHAYSHTILVIKGFRGIFVVIQVTLLQNNFFVFLDAIVYLLSIYLVNFAVELMVVLYEWKKKLEYNWL